MSVKLARAQTSNKKLQCLMKTADEVKTARLNLGQGSSERPPRETDLKLSLNQHIHKKC